MNSYPCGDYSYSLLEGGTARIVAWRGQEAELVIPAALDGLPVTEIGAMAFYNCGLEKVTIPDSVTSIDHRAFSRCKSLTSVILPASVAFIADGAFSKCSWLEQVTILGSKTSVSNLAFDRCNRVTLIAPRGSCAAQWASSKGNPEILSGKADEQHFRLVPRPRTRNKAKRTIERFVLPDGTVGVIYKAGIVCPDDVAHVVIPEGVTCIEAGVISHRKSLTHVTIPSSVTRIGKSAFRGCEGLTSVTLPDSVTHIGANAFRDCSGLHTITIPDSITAIEDSTFFGCRRLGNITLPSSLISIGNDAFHGCGEWDLRSVTIPSSVTRIGSGAFAQTALTSITIPDSVTEIGENPFGSCLESVIISSNHPCLAYQDNILYNKITGMLLHFIPKPDMAEYTIPAYITAIGNGAFRGRSSLQRIIIPDSVRSIGPIAFSFCQGLTRIFIPDSIQSIGYKAFFECRNLTGISIPDSVRSIGYDAFSSHSSTYEYKFKWYCDQKEWYEENRRKKFTIRNVVKDLPPVEGTLIPWDLEGYSVERYCSFHFHPYTYAD